MLVFHATGTGGRTMEELIRAGFIAGVLDITTTELADELAGGVLSAGPDRLEAAGEMGIPQVVSAGALDMVNFGAPETVPAKYADRTFYQHNPLVTLMRTTPEENAALGEIIAEKAQPGEGADGLHDPEERRVARSMSRASRSTTPPPMRPFRRAEEPISPDNVKLVEMDTDINDESFAVEAARLLIEALAERSS